MEPINDPMGYLPLLKEVFPGAIIEEFREQPTTRDVAIGRTIDPNPDYVGWIILPNVGCVICFGYYRKDVTDVLIYNEQYHIRGKLGEFIALDRNNVTSKKIFSGKLPETKGGPNFEFLKEILRNWEKIG